MKQHHFRMTSAIKQSVNHTSVDTLRMPSAIEPSQHFWSADPPAPCTFPGEYNCQSKDKDRGHTGLWCGTISNYHQDAAHTAETALNETCKDPESDSTLYCPGWSLAFLERFSCLLILVLVAWKNVGTLRLMSKRGKPQACGLTFCGGLLVLILGFIGHAEGAKVRPWNQAPYNVWTDGKPEARTGKNIVAAADGCFYMFGGKIGDTLLNDFYKLDPEVGEWTTITTDGQKPPARETFAMAAIGLYIYVHGGQSANGIVCCDPAPQRSVDIML